MANKYKTTIIKLILPMVIFLIITSLLGAQKNNVGYSDVEIKDGKLKYSVWTYKEARTLDLSDLELSSEALGNQPLRIVIYGNVRKFKVILLKRGLAKLKDESSANAQLKSAQDYSRAKGIGLWKSVAAASDPSKPKPPPTIDWNAIWKSVSRFVAAYGGYAAAIGTIMAGIQLLRLYRKKRKLYLLFLGVRSSGKTTLFKRIFYPTERPSECDKPRTTLATTRERSKEQINWGDFVVTPEYIDTAGGKVGEQATEMLQRDDWLQRLIRPSRYVWLIVLATTNKNVSKNDTFDNKVDNGFIREQLGYLALPLGLLQAKDTHKPDMVFVCLSKFDLFSDADPDNESACTALRQIENLFVQHVNRIKEHSNTIPVQVEICSACEGWRTHSIRDSIERKLYKVV